MARWQPDARERLEKAAFDLFVERGFADSTVPEIAQRAGLSTRTFFRHFADKREALFADENAIPELASRMIAEAPEGTSAMQIVADGFDEVAARQFTRPKQYFLARHVVIQSDEGLRERELRKQAALVDALRRGFEGRGIDPLEALLASHLTGTVFSVSIGRWLSPGETASLPELLHDTFDRLRRTADGSAGLASGAPRVAATEPPQ
ncbi:TetR/AcrR family transcriptional regulator [Agreia sp. COWG]|uniref:TetR/AcrR family transcriptional regulator n=1 Tax=Agreia sp. COWG TaxID=2773266 RepID=UPI00192650A5|nr:TetR family transcriptional regulator [Agreia sp. COWG]CAD6002514.1 Transcriptional regulator, TetR family [Agreia sp. COWG]